MRRGGEKLEEPGPDAGLHSLDALEHRIEPAGDIERGAVGVMDPVVGIELDQVEVRLHRPADLLEQGPEIVNHEEKGRPGIEAEAFGFPEPAAATGMCVALEQGDPESAVPQPDRGRKTAEARADHHHMACGGIGNGQILRARRAGVYVRHHQRGTFLNAPSPR